MPSSAPHTNSWYVLLPAQLGIPWYYAMEWRTNAGIDPGRSTWICPSNPRRSNGNNLFHYCVNGLIDGSGSSDRPVRLTAVARPTSVVYMFDSKNLPAVHANQNNPGSFAHTNLHNGGANFVFLDGHVARHSAAAYWDRSTGRARTDNPDFVWIP
ncbi:MAG TPA: hypothetical protein PLH97_09550 [Verrucomicrobiota bacterium]|nr:hypothetical protein [Verrucomicrobiota bacterium]